MSNFMYDEAKRLMQNGSIDWVTDTIKVRLLKTGSSAGTDRTANTFANITTMGTHDGTTDQSVTGRSTVEDGTLHISIMHAGNSTYLSVPAAAASAVPIAALYYKDTGTESTCIPIFYHDQGFSGAAASGSDITIRPSASGLAYF